MSDTNPGITHFFTVSIDSVDLGSWTKMNGIGMTIATVDRPESAMTFFQHHLPGALQYSNITFERPVSPDSAAVMAWVSAYHLLPVPTAGQIVCLDQTGSIVMMWEMIGVTPVSWKGPSMDAFGNPNTAMESLTIAHMGFL
jgi:phage tail-like protein